MSFNSFAFLLGVLPISLVIYWVLRSRGKCSAAQWFMTGASLVWYGFSFWETSPLALPILLVSLIVDYLLLKKMFSLTKISARRVLLTVGVVFNILLICLSRFWVNIPGASFYTFSAIAILVEAYRVNVCEVSVREYAFFLTFFPKMMQGPIAIPSDSLFKGNGRERLDIETVFRAVVLFSIGLFKKVIIAETFGAAVVYAYSDLQHIHTGEALIVLFASAIQLYNDFSGYCDMGMAIAMLFGFDLPLNFDSPYQASNICDFWKRWHITLTRFFTKYLYIPLGGNRKGKLRMYLNFVIIFLVSGLWHGFSLTYVVWGISQGVMFIIVRMILDMVKKKKTADSCKAAQGNCNKNAGFERCFGVRKIGKGLLHGGAVALNFIYFCLTLNVFRAESLSQAGRMFQSIGECWFPRLNVTLANCFNIDELWYVIKVLHLDSWEYGIYIVPVFLLVVMFVVTFFFPNAVKFAKKCRIGVPVMLLTAVMLIWSIVSLNGVATYIYVNF